MTKLRVMRWGDYSGLSRWANVIPNFLIRKREMQKRQRRKCDDKRGHGQGFEDLVLLALKIKQGVKVRNAGGF
jgi:hypothetical protein